MSETTITLAEAQAHLADAQTAITAARSAAQYSIGDKQVIRANIAALQRDIAYWSRMVNELTAAASGVETSGFLTPSWD